jgi:hypothetical protein
VGFRTSGKGVPELVEAWRQWMEPWETYWTEVEEFIDAGDDRVLVLLRDHGRLRGSEAEVKQRRLRAVLVGRGMTPPYRVPLQPGASVIET